MFFFLTISRAASNTFVFSFCLSGKQQEKEFNSYNRDSGVNFSFLQAREKGGAAPMMIDEPSSPEEQSPTQIIQGVLAGFEPKDAELAIL